MKTDSIFYRIFKEYPAAFFELLGQPGDIAQHYKFASVEVKQTSFRIDGVFIGDSSNIPSYFVEVQFQEDKRFFERTIAEIFLFLSQSELVGSWRFVIWVAKRNMLPSLPLKYQIIEPNISIFYLDQLTEMGTKSLGVRIIDLVVCNPDQAREIVPALISEARNMMDSSSQRIVLDLIETILTYKFAKLSYQELTAMFGLSELRETRVYQEAREEGEQIGIQIGRQSEVRLLIRLLSRCVGKVSDRLQTKISMLTMAQMEELGEALLDFNSIQDLDNWLSRI